MKDASRYEHVRLRKVTVSSASLHDDPHGNNDLDGSSSIAGAPAASLDGQGSPIINSPVEAQSGSYVSNPSLSPPTDICFVDERCSVSPLPAAQRDGARDPALNGAALSDTGSAPAIPLENPQLLISAN